MVTLILWHGQFNKHYKVMEGEGYSGFKLQKPVGLGVRSGHLGTSLFKEEKLRMEKD